MSDPHEYQQSADISNEADRLRLIGQRANQVTRHALAQVANSGDVSSIVVGACGIGNEFGTIKEVFPGAEIVGVDSSDKALEIADSTKLATKLLLADIRSLSADPYIEEHGPFDLYFVRQALFHLPNPDVAVEDAMRIVRPGGAVLALEPNWDVAEANWEDFAGFKGAITSAIRSRGGNPNLGITLRELFEASGLRGVSEQTYTDRVESTDDRWIGLGYLVDVARPVVGPFLDAHGFSSPDDMKSRVLKAREVPGNFYIPPDWVVVSGTTEAQLPAAT